MADYKEGDRVRVTVEGRVERFDRGLGLIVRHGLDPRDSRTTLTLQSLDVEVLPKPVYVNHDTTEYRHGDVVRDGDKRLAVRDEGDGDWFVSVPLNKETSSYEWLNGLTEPLTLLVRDGQVVA